MNLNNFNIGDCNQLISLENINVDAQVVYKIIKTIKSTLNKVRINPKGMKLYY